MTILERLGFLEARQKGSHKQFRHPDGRETAVPAIRVGTSLLSSFVRSSATSV
jgi:predicted RNA binding protein YcfA (HicA-like mRNA interferase family)